MSMPETNGVRPNFSGRPAGNRHAYLFHEKVQLHDKKGTVKRILSYFSDKKQMLVLVFLCAAATTIISILGTRLNGYTVDHFIAGKDAAGLAKICVVLLLMYLVSVVTTYLQNVLMVSTAQKTSADIRHDLFAKLQKLPLHYFDTHSSGDLMSRLTNDVDNINTTFSQSIVQLFSGVVNIAGMLIAMLLLSPILTGIGLLMTPLMFLSAKLIAKKAQPHFVKQQEILGDLNGYIEEMVSGQKTVKLFSREKEVEANFSRINTNLTRSAVLAQALSGIMGPVNNVINNTTYLVLTVCGAVFIIHGMFGITVGILFSFLLYMRNFTRPINDIMNLFNTIQSALAGAERVFEVIDETPEQDLPSAQAVSQIKGNVTLQDVDFSYLPGKPILKKVCIQAKAGQTVAIVGPTGAGKTTIINLLTKFYNIDSGQIWIDGKSISEITRKSLRAAVSIVLQDTFLFSESIRENIRYGRLTASDEEVVQAAKEARAHEFIMQMPQRYDTILSDNGSNLSQGQRQLLSIARAILAKSSVLILDEATSSIDTRTEIDIQKAMLTLMQGKTSFVIAHRLSTIRSADQIVVIRDGRVVETGTHDSLMQKHGFYAELYNSQFSTGMAV